jgi:hypothetical protein
MKENGELVGENCETHVTEKGRGEYETKRVGEEEKGERREELWEVKTR